MEKKNNQQEVLVLTETSFALKALIRHTKGNQKWSAEDMGKRLCNGMLKEMFPELMVAMQGQTSQYFVRHINTGEFLLLIDLAEKPGAVEGSCSINPNLFLSTFKMN